MLDKANKWFEKYFEAWLQKNTDDIAQCFVENSSYQFSPFTVPLNGPSEIAKAFRDLLKDQHNESYNFTILNVKGYSIICHCVCRFRECPTNKLVNISGIYIIELDSKGIQCKNLKKWWHRKET